MSKLSLIAILGCLLCYFGAPKAADAAVVDQWALQAIDAEGAWALAGEGSSTVAVGFADTGVAAGHAGLAGAQLVSVDGTSSIADGNGHGTAALGVVGQRSRYAGIAPASRLLVSKVLDDENRGTTAALAAGLDRLADSGARVVNVSVAGPASAAVHQAIVEHPETLFVAAAGNTGTDLDVAPSYPCADPADNVLCVTATGRDDALAGFAAYGAGSVDVAAPGVEIATLTPTGTSRGWSGTSFATPMVTGVAALAFAADPDATVAQVKAAILGSVDAVPALAGRTVSGGRLNAHRALATLLGVPTKPAAAAAAAAVTPAAPAAAAVATAAPTVTAAPVAKKVARPVVVTARATGRRQVVVTVRCTAAQRCTAPLTIRAGAASRRVSGSLARHARRTVKLTVRRGAPSRVQLALGAQRWSVAVTA